MVSSRDVAERFSRQHKNVLQSINKLECSAEFNGLNFQPVEYIDQKGEVRREVWMTRDGFGFLVMGFAGKEAALVKEAFIADFNRMEARLQEIAAEELRRAEEARWKEKEPPMDYSNPAHMLGFVKYLTGKVEEQRHTIEHQEQVISQQTPKVQAFELLQDTSGSMCFRDVAKSLKMNERHFFQWLAAAGWIYKRVSGGQWIGRQEKIDVGYLEHVAVTYGEGKSRIASQCRVTAKGVAAIAQMRKAIN